MIAYGRPRDVLWAIKIGEAYTEIHEAELAAIARTMNVLSDESYVATSEFNRTHSMLYAAGGQRHLDELTRLYDHLVGKSAMYFIIELPETAIDTITRAIREGTGSGAPRRRS